MVRKQDNAAQDPAARLREIVEQAIDAGHYQIGISILREDRKIDHYLETMVFPEGDQVKSAAKIRDMVFENLEGGKGGDKQEPA